MPYALPSLMENVSKRCRHCWRLANCICGKFSQHWCSYSLCTGARMSVIWEGSLWVSHPRERRLHRDGQGLLLSSLPTHAGKWLFLWCREVLIYSSTCQIQSHCRFHDTNLPPTALQILWTISLQRTTCPSHLQRLCTIPEWVNVNCLFFQWSAPVFPGPLD